MATHYLPAIKWMAALSIVGPKGSGKSQLMTVLEHISFSPHPFSCHKKMTGTALRNEFVAAENKTAVVEEADLFPNRSELEGYIISRVNRSTANLPITEQVQVNKGIVWKPMKRNMFGATIIHDRHEFADLAAERRTIIIPVKKKKGRFKKIESDDTLLKSLSLPAFSYDKIPDLFKAEEIEDAPLDTWEPLIRIAASLHDDDWLAWAWSKVVEMGDALSDGQQYELETVALKGVIKGFNDAYGHLRITKDDPLSLSVVTSFVRKEQDRYIHPKTIATKLRQLGIKDIHGRGGDTKIFTTFEEIRKVAEDISYKDDLLV
ncbi:MAG: hypothetical protein ACXABY_28665 [Candidatus Thorarchaeota archaeon]